MSNTYSTVPSRGGSAQSGFAQSGTVESGAAQSPSTTDAAKEQAAQLGQTAADSTKQVAGVAKDEAARVASETKMHAKDLYHQARGELSDQAVSQQKRVASGLRSIGEELSSMASSAPGNGVAADLVSQAASRASGIASWLDQREPGALLDEVKQFAARKPGTFIAIAAVAGVLAGRLTRSVVGAAADEKEAQANAAVPTVSSTESYPAVPAAATYEADPVLGGAGGLGYGEPGYAQPGYSQPGYAQPGYAQPGGAQNEFGGTVRP